MNFSAVLLAGGESRRMGRDKATLLFHGKPLWEHQIRLLRELGPIEIFISGRTDTSWRPNDCEFVPDAQPSRGPLSGMAAAMAKMSSKHLLALAIDMPFMSADYLRSLSELTSPGRGVVPMVGDRAEPLASIYPVEITVDLATALAGNDFSLQALTKKLVASGRLRATSIKSNETKFFRNLNEPFELSEETTAD
jgi:molybdopterin-guanine dinucleotide biosynthesis protein A